MKGPVVTRRVGIIENTTMVRHFGRLPRSPMGLHIARRRTGDNMYRPQLICDQPGVRGFSNPEGQIKTIVKPIRGPIGKGNIDTRIGMVCQKT